LRRPCLIIDNPSVLRRVVEEHVVQHGHAHAEDLVRDPDVVRWIDRYAQELERLTEPAWQETIRDPASRYYREGDEYKRLFRFGRPTDPDARPTDEARVGSEEPRFV
jgi:hypothetical protein